MRTFYLACDLQTQQLVWSCFMFGKQLVSNDDVPQVHNSAFLAGTFGRRYAEKKKSVID